CPSSTRGLPRIESSTRMGLNSKRDLSVLPMDIRPGDVFTDSRGEWEIVGQPFSIRASRIVYARVHKVISRTGLICGRGKRTREWVCDGQREASCGPEDGRNDSATAPGFSDRLTGAAAIRCDG